MRLEGGKAPVERLGASGAIRFLTQYDSGHGDYVEERRALFADWTLEDVIERARRAERSRPQD